MYCICCKKNNVVPLHNSLSEEEIIWKRETRKDGSLVKINNEMIDNGIIHVIDAGYGSKHDGDQFIIAICDDCIKENLENSTLLYWGNYMFADESSILSEVDKSKLKYRRRKNLDDII